MGGPMIYRLFASLAARILHWLRDGKAHCDACCYEYLNEDHNYRWN